MSRRPLVVARSSALPVSYPPEEPQSAKMLVASQSVIDFASRAIARAENPKKRPMRVSPKRIAQALVEAADRARRSDWEGATGAHLVGLYAHLHEGVYGVAATELDAQGWAFASAAANRMVGQQFGGSFESAVEFLRWVWRREEDREKWRRANGRSGGRLGWRVQFCARWLVDDYRVDVARRSR